MLEAVDPWCAGPTVPHRSGAHTWHVVNPAPPSSHPVQLAHPHGHGSYGGYAQPGPDPYAGVGYAGGGDPAAASRGPAPTGATGLPDGWQELSSDGQVYYWNTHTNVTQYERPQ